MHYHIKERIDYMKGMSKGWELFMICLGVYAFAATFAVGVFLAKPDMSELHKENIEDIYALNNVTLLHIYNKGDINEELLEHLVEQIDMEDTKERFQRLQRIYMQHSHQK